MTDIRQAFDGFADALPEPLLLVSTGGIVEAANREARNSVFRPGERFEDVPLNALFETSGAQIEEYLRICSRSPKPVPGVMKLRTANSDTVDYRCHGWTIRGRNEERVILLKLTAREPSISRFLNLNQRIEQLTKQISLRLRAEQAAHEQRELVQVPPLADSGLNSQQCAILEAPEGVGKYPTEARIDG